MHKPIKFLFLFLALLGTIISKAQNIKVSGGKKIDQRLVGTWSGSEKDQQMKDVSRMGNE